MTTDPPSPDDFSPLETLMGKLVHEMTNEELVEYVKQCAALRSSAQTRNAMLRTSSEPKEKKPKATSKKEKDSVSKAMDLLNQLTKLG